MSKKFARSAARLASLIIGARVSRTVGDTVRTAPLRIASTLDLHDGYESRKTLSKTYRVSREE